MAQLSMEDRDFINLELKSLLKKDDMRNIIMKCIKHEKCNILSFLMENGIDIFAGMTAIPALLFQADKGLSYVKIPSHIRSIEAQAFSNISDLTTVVFEEGLENIGKHAFQYTNLVQVNLPEGLTKLGDGAFSNCSNLKQVTIPDSITKLSPEIFKNSDNVVLLANSRKDMPRTARLRCPDSEIEWYKQHLKMKEL